MPCFKFGPIDTWKHLKEGLSHCRIDQGGQCVQGAALSVVGGNTKGTYTMGGKLNNLFPYHHDPISCIKEFIPYYDLNIYRHIFSPECTLGNWEWSQSSSPGAPSLISQKPILF